ncbi:MAG: enoyl-CoA hydratase-related protein [Gammaproteobacteria bacterium]
MELKTVLFAKNDGIATITLNRPQRLNAWTGRMHHEYRWCLEQCEADRGVGVIVITGGGRGFCAGADARALEGHVAMEISIDLALGFSQCPGGHRAHQVVRVAIGEGKELVGAQHTIDQTELERFFG